MDKPTFASLGLSPEILKAVEALGFEEASPIQAAAIPVLLQGGDVVGQSQTGSGKTAAFAIPAIEKIDSTSTAVQVLILCPTRELATQVADEVHKLTAFKRGIHAVPIYGGASYDRQFFELKKGVQIVIGTPGRLIDHLERGTLRLDDLKVVILDEADRMLDMGFREDIERILEATPEERQTVFFSATVSKAIRDLINRFSRDPQTVKIEQKEVSAPAIEQWYYEAHSRMKLETLIRLIDYHGFKSGIIFCNTQRMVDELADALLAQGFAADRLHGGIAQAQRTRVMNKFKKTEFEFLVATDVAARGIDVDDLELVVNYDLPYDAEDYVHRIGRTGRAGKKGMAITFVSGRDIYKLQFIERYTKTKIRRGKVPSVDEVEEKRSETLLDRVRLVLESDGYQQRSTFVDRLLEEGFNSTDLSAALFHLLIGGGENTAPRPAEREASAPQQEAPAAFEKKKKERPARDEFRDEEPAAESRERDRKPYLGAPSRGLQWIKLNVGKGDGFGPREIVDVIATGSGMLGKLVGTIELSRHESFAQVPENFAKGLSLEGNSMEWQGRSILVFPVKSEGKEKPRDFKSKGRESKGRDFKPKFKSKFKKKW
jgi:ATP-dependent RNA helicase DeaD